MTRVLWGHPYLQHSTSAFTWAKRAVGEAQSDQSAGHIKAIAPILLSHERIVQISLMASKHPTYLEGARRW